MWYRCCLFFLFFLALVVSVSGLSVGIMPYVCITGYTGIDGGDYRLTLIPARGNVWEYAIHSGVMVREIVVSLKHVEPGGEIEVATNGAVISHRLEQLIIEDMELRTNVTSG